jgi:4'-phosphopantetheinyl transferase
VNADLMTYPSTGWAESLDNLLLATDEVHIWRIALGQPAPRVALLRRLLAGEEMERAEAFRFRRDREHFIVARALLRIILGRYLCRDPRELCFRYGPRGKPFLEGDGDGSGVEFRFNLSHSGGLALLAVTRGNHIGIDIECIRPYLAYERIADRFFSSEEAASLRTLPRNGIRRKAFFACWTRKEAYIKAIGEGLSCALDRFTVSLSPWEPAALLRVDGSHEVASRWALYELNPGPYYAAALAVEARGRRIRCFQCREEDLGGLRVRPARYMVEVL